jgi:serine/threonine protein kinase
LAQQVPHKLAQVQEMLGLARSHSHVDNNNAKLSESLFDCVLARLRLRLSEFVSPFLSSRSYFPRLVSLTEFARRPVTLDSFRSFRVLGRGAFGAVSAVQRKDTHAIYALKEMDKKQVKAEQSEWMVQNEMHVLSKTRSPFVLGLNYAFHGADLLHLVFPMCTGGDLKFHLRAAEGHRFSESRTRYYASELLLGLEHLHGLDIVYRDLKPQNILLTSGGHLVISDLGLSIKLRKGKVLKHLAGCLRADQEVLRDDGVSVIRADQVRVGMRLAGEHGPVVVEEASPDLASLPTSSDFYRITHEDGSSYVVTGCADAMHLVTVRCTRATVSLRRRVQSCCGRQVMYFANAFDSQTNELRGEYAPRTYRAIDESSDDTLDIPERGMQHQHHCSCVERNALPTLVRQTLAECEAAMWSSWEREELTDPKSLPARASTEGSLVDIPVVTLAANPSWWRHAPDQPTQQTVQPFLSGVRIMTMSKDAAPPHAQHDVALLPPPEHDGGHGHRVLPSSFLSSMAHKKVTCQSLAIASIVPEPTLSPFAPFKVGGNGRYRLVDGTLTHNTAGYWSPEVLSKKGTFKSSDLFSLGVMIYEMLSGARPECKCAKKGAHATGGAGSNNSAAASKEWCPFGQRRSMEENAVDPEGVLRLELEPWPSSISSNPLARDLLTKLLDPNPETRLGAQDLEHIKSHAWFADTDWEAMAKLEVDPPYVPEPRTVNAHSISEVGEADRRGFAHINLTAEDQRAYYDCFRYTSAEGAQQEVVDALTKMDNPHSANNAAANSADQGGDGCCTIL